MTVKELTNTSLQGLCFGIGLVQGMFLGLYLASAWVELRPLNIHITSVGTPVEAGIAARREAMRALGVDVNPVD
jgi:hypothetical protein